MSRATHPLVHRTTIIAPRRNTTSFISNSLDREALAEAKGNVTVRLTMTNYGRACCSAFAFQAEVGHVVVNVVSSVLC